MTPEPPEPALSRTLTVDAVEGRVARVEREDGTTEDLSLAALPRGVREGDVLRVHALGGDLSIEIDHAATRERRRSAQAQLDDLNRASPAGDINL